MNKSQFEGGSGRQTHNEDCPRHASLASYTHNPVTGHTRAWRNDHRRDCSGLSRLQMAVRHIERTVTARVVFNRTITPFVAWRDAVHDARAVAIVYGANWYDVFTALATTREIGHRLDQARRRQHGQQWDITNVPVDRHRLDDVPGNDNEPALFYRGATRIAHETGGAVDTTIVVFATDDNLRALFGAEHLQMDATFDTVRNAFDARQHLHHI